MNHGKRDGLEFEVLQQPLSEAQWQELEAISDAWLTEKNAAEKGFSLGYFDRGFLSRGAGIAVVRHNNRIQAFASIAPFCPALQEFSIDLMRHDADAPNGCMDFLFVQLMLYAQEQGFAWFDLGMAPLAGVGDSDWAALEERIVRMIYQYGNYFYNYKGLRSYKEKFCL